MAVEETKDIAVTGKIKFLDYYGIDGKKCAAILETEDQITICIIDNVVVNKLKKKLMGKPGHIKVFGKVKSIEGEKILEVEEFNILDTKSSPKGSGHESKGSDPEHKGSH